MSKRRIIDTHLHIWDFGVRKNFPNADSEPSFNWPDDETAPLLFRDIPASEAETQLKESGVSEVIFVQCLNNSPDEIRWVRGLSQKYKFFKGIVGGLDLTDHGKLRNFLDEFTESSNCPLVGLRHILDFEDEDYLLRNDVHFGLGILEERGLTFDLLLRPPTLKHVPLLAEKFPNLKFTIDHIAKPLIAKGDIDSEINASWKKNMVQAASYSNVYCKLSGIITEAGLDWSVERVKPFVRHCLKAFGTDRCFFGSDWPVCRLAGGTEHKDVILILDKIIEDLSQENKEKIFWKNAIKFYNLC